MNDVYYKRYIVKQPPWIQCLPSKSMLEKISSMFIRFDGVDETEFALLRARREKVSNSNLKLDRTYWEF